MFNVDVSFAVNFEYWSQYIIFIVNYAAHERISVRGRHSIAIISGQNDFACQIQNEQRGYHCANISSIMM